MKVWIAAPSHREAEKIQNIVLAQFPDSQFQLLFRDYHLPKTINAGSIPDLMISHGTIKARPPDCPSEPVTVLEQNMRKLARVYRTLYLNSSFLSLKLKVFALFYRHRLKLIQ